MKLNALKNPKLMALGLPFAVLSQCAPTQCAPAPVGPAPVVAPVETTTPPPAPTNAGVFGDGTHVDPAPGIYWTDPVAGCYWERLSDLSGEGIITNSYERGPSQHIVEILDSDVAFYAEDCGSWYAFQGASPVTSFGDGDWAVNQQVTPGRWGAQWNNDCYWERASGWSHDDEIITNDYEGLIIVDIAPSDVRFTSSGCGSWIQIG